MQQQTLTGATWRFNSKCGGSESTTDLSVYWEVHLDPISDDYTPDEITASALFRTWVRQVEADPWVKNGLVPIYWYVVGNGVMESCPFQYLHSKWHEDFLNFYSWPEASDTGEPLNWATLPVKDKFWCDTKISKGGFIQEHTSWKPSILQPFVFLGSLIQNTRWKP